MTPQIKAAVRQFTRFLMNLGFSWPKALLVVSLIASVLITLATTITYFVTKVVVSNFITLFGEASGSIIKTALASQIAMVMAFAIFFLLTVGIVLMIDELRNWVIKIFMMAGTLAMAGWLVKLFKPITEGHPRATTLLTATILLFAAGAIAQALGHGDALKSFTWLAKIMAVVFIVWFIVSEIPRPSGANTGQTAPAFGTEPWYVKSNETFELTTESPVVKKDVRANLNEGERQSRWRSVVREGCVELLCDGRSMGVVCPTVSVPDVERCNEVTHRLANGELAKVEMTIEVRRRL